MQDLEDRLVDRELLTYQDTRALYISPLIQYISQSEVPVSTNAKELKGLSMSYI